jgi:hypothetical protein
LHPLVSLEEIVATCKPLLASARTILQQNQNGIEYFENGKEQSPKLWKSDAPLFSHL